MYKLTMLTDEDPMLVKGVEITCNGVLAARLFAGHAATIAHVTELCGSESNRQDFLRGVVLGIAHCVATGTPTFVPPNTDPQPSDGERV
jgi:hypothetical protein